MRDPLTHVTRTIAEMPFFAGRIKSDRQLKDKDNGIATLSVLRSSLVCFAEGIGGIQYGNKSVPVAPERLPEIEASAVQYYTALVTKFGPVDPLHLVLLIKDLRALVAT